MLALIAVAFLIIGYFVYQYWRYRASDTGAPWVTMEPEIVERLLQLAEVGPDDLLVDLGSGDGRIPIMAALKHGAQAVGIEIDKLRYLYSRVHAIVLGLSKQVTFFNGNLADFDLSQATVVTMYLTPGANDLLKEKLIRELKPGTAVVSCSFDFPGWRPVFVDYEHQTRFGPIYLYEMGTSDLPEQPNQPTK